MSVMRRFRPALLYLVVLLFGAAQGYTYTFSFKETNLDNFLQVFYLDVEVDISYSDDGSATFSTTVLNVSPFHFSMYVNGRNCGIVSFLCKFKLQTNEQLNIVMFKMDMQSNLIMFTNRGSQQLPDLYINGCWEALQSKDCVMGSQYSTDSRGVSYKDTICMCMSIFNICPTWTKNDTCISNHPFWNNIAPTLSTSSAAPSTSRLTTLPSTTVETTLTSTVVTTTTRPTTSTTSTPSTTTHRATTSTSATTTVPSTTTYSSTSHSTSPSPTTTTTVSTTTSAPSTTKYVESSTSSTTTMLRPTSTATTSATTTTRIPSTSTTTTETNSTNSSSTSTSSPPPITTTRTADVLAPTLKNLSDSGVGINNVSTVLNETLVYSKQGADLNATQVMEISKILYNAANVPGLRAENSWSILQNLDNMLYVDQATMYQSGNSPQEVLQSLGNMVHNTVDQRIEYLEGTNLGFSSKKIDCTNLASDDGLLDLQTKFELVNSTDSLGKWHSIVVPLSDLCSSQDLTHVYFTIYRDRSLFVGQQQYRSYDGSNLPISSGRAETYTPPPRVSRSVRYEVDVDYDDTTNTTNQTAPVSPCARQTSLPSAPVMSATLLNNGVTVTAITTASSDATMALLRFNVSTISRPLHGSFKVTWWDTGRRKWADDRQCDIISDSGGIIEAKCLHLTDFAIIVDAALNDPNVCDNALITLGYVVNGLSILSLAFLTFFSISAYVKTLSQSRFYSYVRGHNLARRDFLALAYHFDLLLFYVFFTVFSNQYISGSMCTAMAAVMYALLLCSLLLTIFQACRNILVFIPRRFYKVLNVSLSTPAVLFISVALPFTLSIFLLVFTKFFDRQDCFCWVRPDYVVAAIIIPVTVLLFSTVLCTSFMIYKLFCGMKRKFSQGGHHYDPNVITKIVSIVVMQISLGLPWVLQFGTLYSPYTSFWHYTFTIVLGSQGTILLLIFIYKRYRAWQSDSMAKSREPSVLKSRDSTKKKRKIATREESLGSSTDTFYEY